MASEDRATGRRATEDGIRANVYSLLARLLARPPAQEVLELLRTIPPIGAGAGDEGALATAWETLRLASERAAVEALDDEYHDLFIGITHGELVPYGSWYQTGFLMDKPLVYLRQDLKRLGFARQQEVREPEDHAAALLETMGLIIASGDDISFEEQSNFFRSHIESWMGLFFQDMQNAESARFYRAVGQFGERFLEFETQYLTVTS